MKQQQQYSHFERFNILLVLSKQQQILKYDENETKMKRKYSNRNWKSLKFTNIEFEQESTFRFDNNNENEIEYLNIILFIYEM